MINSDPRKPRRLLRVVTGLESRRLLSFSVTSLGQDGHNLVGPDASQGPDAIQDLHLQLSGLSSSSAVDRILITPQGGVSQGSFAWQTQPTLGGNNVPGLGKYGYSMAECFCTSSTTGDLYINPQLDSVAPPAGAGPLVGSTGALVQLEKGNWLTVAGCYRNTTTDSYAFEVTNLSSAMDPMPPITTPSPVTSGAITDHGQDGTGQPYQVGCVHLTVTAPSSVTYNSSDFTGLGQGSSTRNGLVFTLSDQSGLEWDSLSPVTSHNQLNTTHTSPTTVDVYFPPLRSEAPANGTPATLTFQATIPGNSHIYVEQFSPSPLRRVQPGTTLSGSSSAA